MLIQLYKADLELLQIRTVFPAVQRAAIRGQVRVIRIGCTLVYLQSQKAVPNCESGTQAVLVRCTTHELTTQLQSLSYQLLRLLGAVKLQLCGPRSGYQIGDIRPAHLTGGQGILRPPGPHHIQIRKYRQILDSGALAAFLLERWADAPEVLTVAQTSSLCGYGPSAINRRVRDGLVEAVSYRGHNLIFKESLADRLASYEGQTISARSELHQELLEEFQGKEQNSGMEWGSMSL